MTINKEKINKLKREFYNEFKGFSSFKKIKGYPKLKYYDYPTMRIYFIEVAKEKRLQHIAIVGAGGFLQFKMIYEDVTFDIPKVLKKQSFFQKLFGKRQKTFEERCDILEHNLKILIKNLIFFNKYYDKIVKTGEVK